MNQESRLSPSQENWNRQQNKQGYTVSRELDGDLHAQSYIEIAGSFHGMDAYDVIDDKVTNHDRPIRIEDIGCGKAGYLLQCKKEWGSSISASGITAYPYHLEVPGRDAELKQLGIQISIADAQQYEKQKEVDVLTGIHLMRYVFDPLDLLCRMYRALDTDGIGFVFPLAADFWDEFQQKEFVGYLITNYQFEFNTPNRVTFQKTHEELTLPVKINSVKTSGTGTRSAVYSFTY